MNGGCDDVITHDTNRRKSLFTTHNKRSGKATPGPAPAPAPGTGTASVMCAFSRQEKGERHGTQVFCVLVANIPRRIRYTSLQQCVKVFFCSRKK